MAKLMKQPVLTTRLDDDTFLKINELRELFKAARGVELSYKQAIQLIVNQTNFESKLIRLRKEAASKKTVL